MKKFLVILAALLCMLLLLGSCAGGGGESSAQPESSDTSTEPKAIASYRYSAAMGESDNEFTLYDNGTFAFWFDYVCSYTGNGTYTISDGVLTMTTDNMGETVYTYVFTASGDDYLFDKAKTTDTSHTDNYADQSVFKKAS